MTKFEKPGTEIRRKSQFIHSSWIIHSFSNYCFFIPHEGSCSCTTSIPKCKVHQLWWEVLLTWNKLWVGMLWKSNGSFMPEAGVIMSFNNICSITNSEVCFKWTVHSYRWLWIWCLYMDLLTLFCNCVVNKICLRSEVSSLGGGWKVTIDQKLRSLISDNASW